MTVAKRKSGFVKEGGDKKENGRVLVAALIAKNRRREMLEYLGGHKDTGRSRRGLSL